MACGGVDGVSNVFVGHSEVTDFAAPSQWALDLCRRSISELSSSVLRPVLRTAAGSTGIARPGTPSLLGWGSKLTRNPWWKPWWKQVNTHGFHHGGVTVIKVEHVKASPRFPVTSSLVSFWERRNTGPDTELMRFGECVNCQAVIFLNDQLEASCCCHLVSMSHKC